MGGGGGGAAVGRGGKKNTLRNHFLLSTKFKFLREMHGSSVSNGDFSKACTSCNGRPLLFLAPAPKKTSYATAFGL
jgi:hypothetical protein